MDPAEAPVLAEWYRIAEKVGQDEGVRIAVNDYNTLSGPHTYAREAYIKQIEFLVEEHGIDLDGIGLQCHFSRHERLDSNEVIEGLNLYAKYGAALRVTEFDMSDDTWDENDKADFFYEFLKTVFSHPATEDFLVWGYWDGRHWLDDAPFFDMDWNPKPSLDVYRDLVFDEWWTQESGESDEHGRFATEAFFGEHEVSVTYGDESVTETVSVGEDGVTVHLSIDDDTQVQDDVAIPDDEHDGGNPMPGFSIGAGMAALGAAALATLLRSRERRD